jgi:hypothetical protein
MNVNGPIDHLGTPSLKIKDCFLGNKAISSGSIVWGDRVVLLICQHGDIFSLYPFNWKIAHF